MIDTKTTAFLASAVLFAGPILAEEPADLTGALPDFERPALWFGDQAPELGGLEMVRGEPFNLTEGTHVLDFWATWCGPCISGFPHISDLDDQYPDINVVAVNVWEQAEGDALRERVSAFIEGQGDRMRFDIATAPPAGDAWVRAAQQPGIPSSFIVSDGRVVWLGHPNSIDAPLEAIASGDYDLAEAAKSAEETVVFGQRQAAIIEVLKSGDSERGVALAEIVTGQASPYDAGMLVRAILSRNDVDSSQPDLSSFAIDTLRSVVESEPPFLSIHFDSLAMAYAAIGDYENAAAAQQSAVETEPDPKNLGWLSTRLDQYKSKLDANS